MLTYEHDRLALEQELSAVVFISSRPVDAFVRGGWEPDFNFLPINYESKFEDYYLPSGIRGGPLRRLPLFKNRPVAGARV